MDFPIMSIVNLLVQCPQITQENLNKSEQILHFSSFYLNKEKDEEKSQKERILTASKTIWMLTSWHKTLVSALGSVQVLYKHVWGGWGSDQKCLFCLWGLEAKCLYNRSQFLFP